MAIGEAEIPFCDVLVETQAMRTWATLTGGQQRSWLQWIDADPAWCHARQYEAANRLIDGQLLPPGWSLVRRARDVCTAFLKIA